MSQYNSNKAHVRPSISLKPVAKHFCGTFRFDNLTIQPALCSDWPGVQMC